jgi:hypothetical protein
LPYRLCCFLRFVLGRLRALDGWEVSGELLGCSTDRALDGWEVSGELLGCSTGFGFSDGWEVSRLSAARPASGSPMVGRCILFSAAVDGSGGAEDAEVALFSAVEEWWGQGLKPEISSSWLENLSRKDRRTI